MRKIISLLLAVMCLLSMMSGCASGPVSQGIQGNERTENKKESAMNTDTCKLGSPIRVETTVKQGWDDDHQAVMSAIQNAVEIAGVTDGMLQVEAIERINEYLCQKTVYGENKYCRTIRGSLILHQAVCVGYTLAFQYMAQYCGINAVYVHGRTKTTAHAWNGVYFSDGTYFEVDVTMNDTSGEFTKYLLISPVEMERLHFL